MATPILNTKLHIPSRRPELISRPLLIERLNEGLSYNHKLTLIVAPAGFGKTTLASNWATASQRKVAWLSLEPADSDINRFLTYLLTALQGVSANLGAGLVELLQTSQPISTQPLLTSLVNEISELPDNFLLILDDYHLITSEAVDQALAFLLEHLPPQMHLVIVSRADPQLPLARLRARHLLTELRLADLRFTPPEATEFLRQTLNLDLAEEEISTLQTRTEGWVAGLQLAALSIQGHHDTAEFVRTFAGDHRYILDFLVEEVLQHQPTPVRQFLLQTAILERLSGALCEAVTGQAAGQARLEMLERGNFFIVALDDKRQWYRYHHLFAEVLYKCLTTEQPEQLPALHRRASLWYANNGFITEAIHHAQAAGDGERVADLAEIALPEIRRNRQAALFLSWIKALPDELIKSRPVLSVGYAWALLADGKLELVETYLAAAERGLLETTNVPGPVCDNARMPAVNAEEFDRLPAMIAVYRAGVAQIRGDLPATVKYARQVLDLLPPEDYLGRGAAGSLLGLTYWTSGELEAAYQTFAEGRLLVEKAGNISDAVSGAIALADIRIAQGRLREAMTIYEQSLQLANSYPTTAVMRGAAELYVGMSELYREYNELDKAKQYLLKGQELGERSWLPQNWYRWFVAMARLKEAQGDLDGTLSLLDEAARVYMRDFFPDVRPVAALKTRIWLAQGRLEEALAWARAKDVSANATLSYLREFEHITLARLLLARYNHQPTESYILEAIKLLKRLQKAAQEGARTGSLIEIQILLALAYSRMDNSSVALQSLQQALTLAEPEGYVRLFVDEGEAMAALLRKAVSGKIMADYAGKLLSALQVESSGRTDRFLPAAPTNAGLLTEPLSQRELEVLRLLKTELTGPEIARELTVALSTVRTHTKSIFSKLDVNNRRAAVKRAEDLKLI